MLRAWAGMICTARKGRREGLAPSSTGSGTDGQAIVLAVDLGGGNFIFATATSAPGEIAGFEPTLLAILESLTYTPLAVPVPESTP